MLPILRVVVGDGESSLKTVAIKTDTVIESMKQQLRGRRRRRIRK